jgi:hypothetical protein
VDEAEQVFCGDRFHGEGVAVVVGEVDEVGFVVEGYEDGSDLTALELEGFLGLFVGGGLWLGEGDEVVVLEFVSEVGAIAVGEFHCGWVMLLWFDRSLAGWQVAEGAIGFGGGAVGVL